VAETTGTDGLGAASDDVLSRVTCLYLDTNQFCSEPIIFDLCLDGEKV
jgi:hypothetical protein